MPQPLSFDHLQAILRQHTAGLPERIGKSNTILVGSRAGAVAVGPGSSGLPAAFAICRCLSPSLDSVSNSRHVKPSVPFSGTGLSCSLHLKVYGTYRLGALSVQDCTTRYPL